MCLYCAGISSEIARAPPTAPAACAGKRSATEKREGLLRPAA
uniref:Uncharacterized protein n=1 Tax=Arundo donax TaxID=35708 RepID=A0A0A9FKD2_ARUDO